MTNWFLLFLETSFPRYPHGSLSHASNLLISDTFSTNPNLKSHPQLHPLPPPLDIIFALTTKLWCNLFRLFIVCLHDDEDPCSVPSSQIIPLRYRHMAGVGGTQRAKPGWPLLWSSGCKLELEQGFKKETECVCTRKGLQQSPEMDGVSGERAVMECSGRWGGKDEIGPDAEGTWVPREELIL